MSGFPIRIFDPLRNAYAKVVNGGALAVLPPEYNGIFSAELTEIDEVANLINAKPDEFFVGNLLVITGDKNISNVDDAIIRIYAAESADEAWTPENPETLTLHLERSGQRIIPSMNIATLKRGAYINCMSDQVNVSITLFGYYTRETKT